MIAIIDYDAGNVKSVQKALAYLHEDTILTRDPKQLLAAEKVILPGVGAFGDAMGKLKEYGLIDNWLRNIKDINYKYRDHIEEIEDEHERQDYMCELNVLEQVANVCYTSIVQNAWRRGQELAVHGWIYDVKDGLLRDLDITVNALEQIPDVYRSSCEKVSALHQHK